MRRTTLAATAGAAALAMLAACGEAQKQQTEGGGEVPNSKVTGRDDKATLPSDPAMVAKEGGPMLGAVQMAVKIYEKPDHRSKELGYLRVGGRLTRAEKAAGFDSCQNGFYHVLPRGFVCLDDGATIDMAHPLMRAELRGPDRDRPLPYAYAFVRAIAPRYYRLPKKKEQYEYEMALERHIRSFGRLHDDWNGYEVGANDVRMLPEGVVLGPPPEEPPSLDVYQRFGGDGSGKVPWFLDTERKIPNVANFKVPDYAIITNRIKRHAGVALIDAFAGDERDFALTTDLRLIPTSKLKPGRGSTFHGVELTEGFELPVAFVKRDGAWEHEKKEGRYRRTKKALAYGVAVQLTGEFKGSGDDRWLETEDRTWMKEKDIAIAAKNMKLPEFASGTTKWIDVSIQRQTLTLFEGSKPIYATMISTGKDGLGDPAKTYSTPTGTFKIRDKHITDTMDSQMLGSEFELNDVPYVEYFKAGYALHAAYWHTEYGRPRSHGCINMSPIDAYRLFRWTDPQVPDKWHGVDAGDAMGEGTTIYIHP
jgi:lipoprotein-anchoring transpeptidase ErfK/SrfK